MKKLTGVLIIETGVVNRGDGVGNIATVKKVSTNNGVKVFFSPVSYKRALWDSLRDSMGWTQPIVTREGGVVQRTGTIIDSEEFDFGGTMVAKPKYERYGTFLVDNAISINDFTGDMEFMTNMAIAKMYGENETNIINKENFYGIYLLPFVLEINNTGIQIIKEPDTGISNNESIEEKIKKIYKKLKLEKEITDDVIVKLKDRVHTINYNNIDKTTKIVLEKKERKRRIFQLLSGIGELYKRIEGTPKNLTPFIAAFSLDYIAPKYLLYIKEQLRNNKSISTDKIINFGKEDGKEIFAASYSNYTKSINDLMDKIEKEL